LSTFPSHRPADSAWARHTTPPGQSKSLLGRRQGSPGLRWGTYEAAQAACRLSSLDRADYLELKARGLSHTRASLTIVRKLARRWFHTFLALGPEALEPVS
jgi:hypothetical protein